MASRSTAVVAGVALAGAALAVVLLLLSSSDGPDGTAGPDDQLGTQPSPGVSLSAPDDPRDPPPLADTEVPDGSDPRLGPTPQASETPGPHPAPRGWQARVRTPNGRPVPEAEIQWLDLRREERGFLARTDHEGRVTLHALPPSGVLEVSAAGHATQVVAPEPGSETVIVLLPRRTVLGDVVAAEDRAPLVGAVVMAESVSWRGRAETDVNGRFELQPPEGEPINLFVSYPQRVSAIADETDGLTIALARGRSVRGQLIDAQANPVTGEVFVYGAAQLTRPQQATTDERGQFEVWGIDPEEEFAVLAFSAQGATPLELEWWRSDTETVTVTVLERGRLVLVRGPSEGTLGLQRADAPPGLPPLAKGEAVVDPTGGAESSQVVWTVAAGSYQLTLDDQPRGPMVPVSPAETIRLSWRDAVLELEASVEPAPTGTVRLQVLVLDAGGQGVPEATVIASVGGHERTATTDERGAVVFDDLPEQPLTISASQAGKVLLRSEFVDPAEQGGQHVVLTLAKPVTLQGVVVPARPAELRLALADGDEIVLEARADDDGTFDLSGLVPAQYQLTVSAEDRLPVTLELTLPLSGPLRVELEEDPRAHGHHHGDGEGEDE